MKNARFNTLIKSAIIMLFVIAGSFKFHSDIFEPARLRLISESGLPLSEIVLSVWWLFLLLIVYDILFQKKLSLFVAPAIHFFTFFTANDALWASQLVWNKNHLLIASCLVIYLAAIFWVVYITDRNFTWLFKNKKNPNPRNAAYEWKALSGWNKAWLLIGIVGLSLITMYVPYQVLVCTGYLMAKDNQTITAKITGSGSIRGKYFYHRYWTIELDRSNEQFWVYSAAKTQPVQSHTCSTSPDAPAGSTLVLQVRKGPFGLSYDRILKIMDESGKVSCE
ncbi:hypothetical protein [Pedobacter sp. MC2016-24]|uniref:hypothetical protein n=1 Tax=Pedobacter sp. MC2016-24 TaxID=2780090 RepID=UPI001881E66E|nr:hypothetical protein [Pedobacter sp. MC2016-24]MBE9601485.1 hypothetical protein [Pedobacter sp. MC2016-24]